MLALTNSSGDDIIGGNPLSLQVGLMSQLFRNAPDAICAADNEGYIQLANDAFCALFGLEKTDIVGLSIHTLFASEKSYTLVAESLASTGTFVGEVLNKRKNAEHFVAQLQANVIYNDAGQAIGTMGVSRDVTQERQLAAVHKTVVDSATDLIYTTRFDGFFAFVNDAFCSFFGFSQEEMLQKHFSDMLHPDDKDAVIAFYQDQFSTQEKHTYLEFRCQTKQGEAVWVGQNVELRALGDRVEGFSAIVRDITDRKEAERAMIESESRYRELVDAASDLIHSIDGQGNLTFANQAWCEVMGYSRSEVTTLNVFDLIHPDDMDHCQTLFDCIIGEQYLPEERVKFSLRSSTGRKISVDAWLAPKFENGKLVALRSFMRDLTLQLETEAKLATAETQLSRVSETIDEVFFLYNVEKQEFEFVSKNCGSVFGLEPAQFYGSTKREGLAIHKDDLPILQAAHRRAASGYRAVAEFRIAVGEQWIWVLEKLFPIKDGKGKTAKYSGLSTDITRSKRQEEIIVSQSKEIAEAIRYAQRIQTASLPSQLHLNSVLNDAFVLFEPRDELSGDFYLAQVITTNSGRQLPLFLTADCTGHGIPGAVLSALCQSLLYQSFTKREVNSPADVLSYVRSELLKFFSRGGQELIKDGMDISLCVLDTENQRLNFAGANQNCQIVRNGQLFELSGDRHPVGYSENMEPFTNHAFDYVPGDCVYIFSDGYYDQFGGPRGRKLMRQNLKKRLLKIAHEPTDQQLELLRYDFRKWKGDHPQVDDVVLMGVRL